MVHYVLLAAEHCPCFLENSEGVNVDDVINTTKDDPLGTPPAGDDLEVLTEILAAFRRLEPESRERMLDTVRTFLAIGPISYTKSSTSPQQETRRMTLETPFSEDRTISPKQFIFDKQPNTDVERVACLAYYLTHYRGAPHFKTLDISKLNTEAAQLKFSNAAVAVDNASKLRYLVPATKGSKQLSAMGEQFVLALPDRERARAIMAKARPRRKARRSTEEQVEE